MTTRMFTTRNNPGHASALNVKHSPRGFSVEIKMHLHPAIKLLTTLSNDEAQQLSNYIQTKLKGAKHG